ncbi:EF-hand domain-containing protein [Sphingomonas sp. NIBR02145]|uniref:EF-hand domain-containing protein n=1 Tax=Sphingomonas sp. NIBR02145 TaxID=3014784 RepID=UPI003390057B
MVRTLLLGAALAVAAPAYAQMGPGGGGGGFPGGGGGPGGPGGRGGPPGGGPGGGRPKMMKPVKREKLDKVVTEMFRTADKNGDGLVTFEELKTVIEARRDARIKARFERIDTDHNGSLSAAEFFAWQHDMGSVASAEHQPVAEIGGPVSESIMPDLDEDDMALRRLVEPLNAMVIVNANTNYDNGVSLDELLAYERKKFDAADADHDGALTMEELRSLEPRDRDGPGGPGGPGGFGGPMGRPPRGEE